MGEYDDYLEDPNEGFLTSEEMLAAEVDIAKGLGTMDDRAAMLTKSPILLKRRPTTELWLRNPMGYLNALYDVPFPRFIHNAEYSKHKQIYPVLAEVLPDAMDFQLMVVKAPAEVYLYTRSGSDPALYRGEIRPVARVPAWKWGDNPEDLIRMCRAAERRGWDRIVVGWLPRKMRKGDVKTANEHRARTFAWLHRVGQAFPEVNLHLFGGTEYRHTFGLEFASADIDPMRDVLKYRVTLPNGRSMAEEKARLNLRWMHVLGYGADDIMTSKNRVLFNMHSAMWASENYTDERALRYTRNGRREDPYGLLPERKGKVAKPETFSSREYSNRGVRPPLKSLTKLDPRLFEPETTPDFFPQFGPDPKEAYDHVQPISALPLVPVRARRPETMDKILCDSCSLAPSCKYVRDRGVCIVPSSETKGLARLFGTRDVDTLKEALQGVLATQATRHAVLAESWDADFADAEQGYRSKIDKSKHLTELENSLTRGVEALIKIMDPSQRIGNLPATNATQINVYNPATLVADVVKRLEAAGIDRASISPAMVIEAAREQGITIEGGQ